MKTIKPQKLAVLSRTFEVDRRQYLVVSACLFIPLGETRNVCTEVEMWKTVGPELGQSALDEGWSKPRGEVLVTGKCMAPGGVARPVSYVRVKLGAIDKRLAVIGDRVWKNDVPTPPTPFVAMPLDLTRAFGGPEHLDNPTGKGSAPVADVHALPNVELPDRLITSPKHRPPPATLGPLPLDWPERRAKAGTYDQQWLATRAPGIPKDTDLGFFNTAPADQQLPGYLRGDEAFVVEHMHAAKPWIEGRLPGLIARAFITQKKAEGDAFRELTMRLDTVRFFPNADRAVLVYRGMIEVVEDDAADVLHLVAACEDPAAPKPLQHYRDVLALRLDRKKGALASLRDSDLMPVAAPGLTPAPKSEFAMMLTGEDLLRKNMRRRQEAEHAAFSSKLEAQGLAPLAPLPSEDAPPDLEDPDALFVMIEKQQAIADEQLKAAEVKRAEREAEFRKVCAKEGVDFEKIAGAHLGGPPKFSAEQQIAALPPAVVAANPKLPQKLRDAEAQVLAAYRTTAHLQPAPKALDAAARARRGAALAAALAKGESLATRDFTGASLAGHDLRGANLSSVFLEGADLTGADLTGANLSNAVLARATFHKARLASANLAGANLGEASASGVDFSGADLSGAILMKADLIEAKLANAKLDGVDLMETRLVKADLSGATASGMRVLHANLTGAKFVGASLDKCVFVEAELPGADFTNATSTRLTFVTCNGDGALFRRAKLDSAAFVQGSSFADADFREARLVSANLRGTNLARGMFDGARLDGADLSECDLSSATLLRARAPSAMLVRTNLTGAKAAGANLMNAILQKANLAGADLSGCNLFRADLARVKTDGKTKLDRALLKQARVNPRSTDGSA